MNIMSLLSSIIVSGSLGYLNYIILEKLGTVSFHKNTQDEKKMVLLIFSALNYGVYLAVASKIEGAENGDYGAIALSIFIVIIIVSLGSILLHPCILCFKNLLDYIRCNLLKKGRVNIEPVRTEFFQSSKPQDIYIFDLDNKLLTCGYFNLSPSTEWDYFDLSLVPFYDVLENQISYEDVINKTLDPSFKSKVLIDFEKKIKIIKFEPIS
ncbi:hypothetical protein ACQUE6_14485 [Enterococcus casseliflavus]|uniref:hypothetical protein n=1 Tax=Enterococcus casseliflavus TaxID=37734 RepID=UPI003D150124